MNLACPHGLVHVAVPLSSRAYVRRTRCNLRWWRGLAHRSRYGASYGLSDDTLASIDRVMVELRESDEDPSCLWCLTDRLLT